MLHKSDEEQLAKNAVRKLEWYATHLDTDAAHRLADAQLCNLLKKLGFSRVVEAYDNIEKWYA